MAFMIIFAKGHSFKRHMILSAQTCIDRQACNQHRSHTLTQCHLLVSRGAVIGQPNAARIRQEQVNEVMSTQKQPNAGRNGQEQSNAARSNKKEPNVARSSEMQL